MSARPSPFAARLRRELLAKGLTLKPTCEACGREVEPTQMRGTFCPSCKAERDEVSAYFQRLNDETDWPVLPAPAYPMFDHDDGRPFPEAD
jgi:hypothetical protein